MTTSTAEPEPPLDGLRAWLVALACFLSHFVAMGAALSFGLVQKTILLAPDQAGLGPVSAFSLSLVASLAVGCITLVGIVAGWLTDRFGPCHVVLVGAICALVGPLVGSFATAVWQLLLSYSLIFGTGSAFTLMPCTAATSLWFTQRRRNIALSIGVSGSGAGGLVYSWITQALLDRGGWRFAFRVQGGISCLLLLVTWACVKERRTGHELAANSLVAPISDDGSPTSPGTAVAEIDLESITKDFNVIEETSNLSTAPPKEPQIPRWLLLRLPSFPLAIIYSPACTLTFAYVFIGSFTLFVPQTFAALAVSDVCPTCASGIGAAVVATMAGLLALGRILVGILATFIGTQNALVLSLIICCVSMLGVWFPFANNPGGSLAPIWVMGVLWGLFSGGIVVTVPATAAAEIANVKSLAATIDGMKRRELDEGTSDNRPSPPAQAKQIAGLATLISVLYVAYGAGDLFGPAVGGAIVDASTHYDPVTGQRIEADWRWLILYVAGTYVVSTAVAVVLRWYTNPNVFVRV